MYAQKRSWQQHCCQPGFTLAELMIVILIMGVLMGIGIPAYWAFAERAKKRATRTTLTNIQQQIQMFKSDTGKYPQKLSDLVDKPSGALGKEWEGPYFKKEPRDGWKQEFEYKRTPGGKHSFDLYSYGKGGPEDSSEEDEINVWDL